MWRVTLRRMLSFVLSLGVLAGVLWLLLQMYVTLVTLD
jgi:hypothetical protein